MKIQNECNNRQEERSVSNRQSKFERSSKVDENVWGLLLNSDFHKSKTQQFLFKQHVNFDASIEQPIISSTSTQFQFNQYSIVYIYFMKNVSYIVIHVVNII